MVMSRTLIASMQRKKKRTSSKAIRRGRKRQKGDPFVAPEIPLDLLIEILTRLPAKSLMRFKCVSMLWSSLIRSRYFSNRYLTVTASPRFQPPPRLYMSLVDHLLCRSSIDVCHNPYESVLLSLSSSTSAECFDQDLTIPGMGGRNMVVLRGLILYNVCRKACIYNPTTRQSVTLPAVNSNIFAQEYYRKTVLYFFGHDPVLDQYKVVCTVVVSSKRFRILTSEHWVFVLEPGSSWKRIEFGQPHHVPSRLGLCIDGVIYYLACTSRDNDIVVSFDVRSEAFSIIKAPPPVVSSYGKSVGFIEYDGKPAVFDYTNLSQKGLVDLWVLGVAGRWLRKSLVLKPCQLHLVSCNNIDCFRVEGTTQDGKVILSPFPLISPYYIIYYDLQNNDLSKVWIRGIPEHWFRKPVKTGFYLFFKHMDKCESILHLET